MQPLDVVYTWVDDRFPGFHDERSRYARDRHDSSPNRTRDNLDLLKYSLRGLEKFAEWCGRIFVVTPRPQIPTWLQTDHSAIHIVHLDEIMPADLLPSYNSFAIESYVHTIRGLSTRFVHFNDDMLLVAPVAREWLESDAGLLQFYFDSKLLPSDTRLNPDAPPMEAARKNTNFVLEREFGKRVYWQQAHHPRIVDRQDMAELVERFSPQFDATRRSRFRARDNILPHCLLAAYLVATGRASFNESDQRMQYVGLGDSAFGNRIALWRAMRRRPAFLALNDDFGARPNRRAEVVVLRFLEKHFPLRSGFDRS